MPLNKDSFPFVAAGLFWCRRLAPNLHRRETRRIPSHFHSRFQETGKALIVKASPFLLQISGLFELLVLLGFDWSSLGVVVTRIVMICSELKIAFYQFLPEIKKSAIGRQIIF